MSSDGIHLHAGVQLSACYNFNDIISASTLGYDKDTMKDKGLASMIVGVALVISSTLHIKDEVTRHAHIE